MAKESSEGEFLKKTSVITSGNGLKIYPRQTLSSKEVIHLDQLEFLPVYQSFPTADRSFLCHRVLVRYIIHLYCLAVQAGFYSDVVEC